MSSPAVSCVRHLMEEYRRFLRSTYRLADPHLRQQFEQHVNQTDILMKGPYVTPAWDYEVALDGRDVVSEWSYFPPLGCISSFAKSATDRLQPTFPSARH